MVRVYCLAYCFNILTTVYSIKQYIVINSTPIPTKTYNSCEWTNQKRSTQVHRTQLYVQFGQSGRSKVEQTMSHVGYVQADPDVRSVDRTARCVAIYSDHDVVRIWAALAVWAVYTMSSFPTDSCTRTPLNAAYVNTYKAYTTAPLPNRPTSQTTVHQRTTQYCYL